MPVAGSRAVSFHLLSIHTEMPSEWLSELFWGAFPVPDEVSHRDGECPRYRCVLPMMGGKEKGPRRQPEVGVLFFAF